MQNVKKYIAEFLGTAILVIFGCGTACVVGCQTTFPGYLVTSLAFGLVIVAMAYSIGNISGCHINPAVSLAMFINGSLQIADFIGYLIAQFLGGIAGSALLYYFIGTKGNFGANGLYDSDILKSLIIEIVLTFVFVFTIMGVTAKKENAPTTGLVIGLSLTLVHILGIYFTGTSVNPARSFGPAMFAGGDALKYVWVFLVAPLIGGALAAFAYKWLSANKE
ncbi:MAG: MIP family channel protein [Ruminococcaceae bacterium]|nr:MIP family channel protein [Oscillospiraceae bacterium]